MKKIYTLIYTTLFLLLSAQYSYAQDYCIDGRFDTYLFDSTQTETLYNINYADAVNDSGTLEHLLLDVYRPLPALDYLTKKPLLIFVHGGSIQGGSKNSAGAEFSAKDLAQKGFICSTINYRLGWNDLGDCNGDTASLQLAFYRAIQDTKAAIRYLKENAEIYGIDTAYIFLMGNSVGCPVSIYSAYAQQSDYDAYQYEALGSIDSSGNTIYNQQVNIKGIIGKAAGIEKIQILNNKDIPMLMFHGTCDTIVPYNETPLFNCYSPIKYMTYHGSWSMARYLQSKNKKYELYTNEGFGHDAVEDDTLALYSGVFLKNILCNTLQTKEYYRHNRGGCIVGENETLTIDACYPNPLSDELHLDLTGQFYGDLHLDIYDLLGQLVYSNILYFAAPITNYTIPISNIGLARGVYILKLWHNNISKTIQLLK